MILISHRGNILGKQENLENTPSYIAQAIRLGYEVEVDLWCVDKNLYLGHDTPETKISLSFFTRRATKLWIHCKNTDALEFLRGTNLNYFWHQKDDVTITSKGFLWAYPGKQPIENSIAVLPEIFNDDTSKCIGICSDLISKYKNNGGDI